MKIKTWKNESVAPFSFAPNLTSHSVPVVTHSLKLSTLLIFSEGFSRTRKAAKFAVYDETMISVKNHQTLAARRIDAALHFFFTQNNLLHFTESKLKLKWFYTLVRFHCLVVAMHLENRVQRIFPGPKRNREMYKENSFESYIHVLILAEY